MIKLTDPRDWADIPKRPDFMVAVIAFTIGAVGLTVRLWAFLQLLVQEPFWYDEAFTYLVAQRPLAELIAATAADVHPPLWYLLVKLYHPYPTEAVRLLPLAFSLLGMWLYYQVLKGIPALNTPARLAALALMALSPVQLFYATELRMYAMLQALVLLQLLAIQRRQYWLFGLATVAALYTHNYAILYTVVLFAMAAIQELRQPTHVPPAGSPLAGFAGHHYTKIDETRILGLVGWSAVAVGCYLPWAAVLIRQMQFVGSGMHWVRPLTVGQAADSIFGVNVGWNFPGNTGTILYPIFIGGLALALWSAIRARQYMLIAWALGPFALAVLGSLLVSPMMLYRGLIGSTGGVYALLVLALTGGGRWKLAGAALLTAGITVVLSSYLYLVDTGQTKNVDYNSRVEIGPGIIVHMVDGTLVSMSAYPQDNTTHLMLDAGCPETISGLGPRVRQAMDLRSIPIEELPQTYTLVVGVGGFSNACQEAVYHKLTDGRLPLYFERGTSSIFGIWSIEESYGRTN